MSQIDWSKAPEGATHKAIGGCWYRIEGDSVQFFNGFRKWSDRSPLSDYSNCWDDFIARPVSEEWTGEGLPPVGTVCLMLQHKCPPVEVQIRYQEANICVLVETSIAREFCTAYAHKLEFRPIRTPEQIAAEARDAAIKDLMQIDDVYSEQAAAIYDRGYRKFEIVDE